MKKLITLSLFSFLFTQISVAQTYNLGISPSTACGACTAPCNTGGFCAPVGGTPSNCTPALTVTTPDIIVPPNSNVRVQITTNACDISVDGLDAGDFCYVNGTAIVTGAGNTRVNYDQCFFTGAAASTANVALTANRRDETVKVIFTVSAGAGTGCSALPSPLRISLSSFTGDKLADGSIKLKWTTESEHNNSYFEVEKSSNGYDFFAISKVFSKGNSSHQVNYEYTDYGPNFTNTYYRLKSVDNNGVETYSKVVLILDKKATNILYVYPNPANDFATVSSNILLKEISLYNMSNQLILEKKLQSVNSYQLLLSTLPRGIYMIKASTGKDILISKIVVGN
jgi:Secretion system C-terminal sorting domain